MNVNIFGILTSVSELLKASHKYEINKLKNKFTHWAVTPSAAAT